MTNLNAEQQKDVLENAPEDLRFDIISGGQDTYNDYKEKVKYTTPTTASQSFLAQNPYYNAMAVKNQKSIYAMDIAFKPIKSDSALSNFIGYWQKQVLSEEYNSTYLEAIEAQGWKKDYLENKLNQISIDLNQLPTAESVGEKLNETLASFSRSFAKATPYIGLGAVATAVAPVGLTGAAIIGGTARAVGGFAQTYKPTQEQLAVELLQENPNLTKDQALEMAKAPAILSGIAEGAGDVIGVSGKAYSKLINTPVEFYKKNLREQLASKIANKTLKQRFTNFMLKEAPKDATGEALTEVLQNQFGREGKKGKGTVDILTSTVDNMLGLIGRAVNGEMTDDDREDIETALLTFGADLILGGGMTGVRNGFNTLLDRSGEVSFKKKVEKFNTAIGKSEMPTQMVGEIIKTEVENGIVPNRVYAYSSEVVKAIDDELNENTELSDESRTILEQIREKAQEATNTTGVLELDGELYFNTIVNPKFSNTLYQRTKESFYEKASMVKGDFTDSQAMLQIVKESLPNALDEDSAFFDAKSVFDNNTEMSEQDKIADAMSFQVLMNFTGNATGKTYQDLKKENNIKFDIPKGLFGKEKSTTENVALNELNTAITNGLSPKETGSQIIVDENNNVVDGNKQVEALKAKGETNAEVKRVSNDIAQNIKDERFRLLEKAIPSLNDEEIFDLINGLSFDEIKNIIGVSQYTPTKEQNVETETEKQKRKKDFEKLVSNLKEHLKSINPNSKQPVFSNNDGAVGLTGINRDARDNDAYTAQINVNPAVFLNLASSEFDENVDYLEQQSNNGKELATPWLEIKVVDADKKILKVKGHEGRHRSLLALLTKTESIPVVLYGRDVFKYKINDNINDWTIVAQDSENRSLRHEFQKDFHNYSIKIGEANNPEITRTFYQGVAGSLSYSPKEILLSLTQEANPTTFAHESFHLFEVLMNRAFIKGELKDDVLAMYKKMFKGVNIDIEQYKNVLAEPNSLNMFLGTQSKTADPLKLWTALDALKAGKDSEQVRQETGWFKGVDGRLRYEISDADAEILNVPYARTSTLGQFFKHDKLYAAYPDLKNLKFVWNGRLKRALARYCPPFSTRADITEHIEVQPKFKNDKKALISEILHEVQHYIQKHEGFSLSGAGYWQTSHENESRKVQGRMNMTEEEIRKSNPLTYTGYREPYPSSKQTVGITKPETLPPRPTVETTPTGINIVVPEPVAPKATTQVLPNELTDALEQLSEAWTQYLGEGKEPNTMFKDMFAWFKNMFAGIYNLFARNNALTPQVREVYDEIFLRQQEATMTAKALHLGGMAKPKDVSNENYAKYILALERLTAGASNKVISSMSKIKNEVKKSQKYLTAKADFEKDLRNSLKNDTTFKVQEFNSKTKLPLEAACVEYNNINGTNLSTAEYEGMLKKPTLDEVVNSKLAEKMMDWLKLNYPELYRDMKIYNTIINGDLIDVLAWESSFISGQSFTKTIGEIRNRVKDFVSKQKLGAIMETEKYKDMLRNNLMLQDEKGADLAKLKLNQAVISSIITKSLDYEKKYKSVVKKLERYKADPDKQEVKSLDAYTRDLLKAIGFNFGIHNKRPRENLSLENLFANWIDEHDNMRLDRNLSDTLNFGIKILSNPDAVKNLEVGTFDDFGLLVKSIEEIGKQDTLGNKQENEAALSADVQETVDYLKQIKFTSKIKDRTFMSFITYGGMMMPRLLSKILPEQINLKYIAPLVSGFSKASIWKNERAKEFAKILEAEMPRLKEIELVQLDNGETISMTREEKILMLCNSVNEHNAGCMMLMIQNSPLRFGQTLRQIENESASALRQRKEELAFQTYKKILESCDQSLQQTANAILAKIESHKDEFKQATFDADGTILKFVEPSHFKFDGSILDENLGYFPSPKKTSLTIDESFDTDFINRSGFPTAQFAKDRTAIHGDCELSLDVINRWIRCVGDYINMAAPWKNLSAFLNKDQILRGAFGETAFSKINDWMKNLRQPEKTNYFLRQLDNLSNICILGLSPLKAVRQLSGLTFSSADVGIGNVLNAMGEVFSSGNINFMKMATELSDYMKVRYSDPSVYIFGGFSNYEVNKNVAKEALGKWGEFALWPLTYMDAFASVVTWKAQYNKSMLEGKTEQQAKYEADRAVMVTQGESSALARPEALRGNLRFLSKYSTYFFALNSALASDFMTRADPKSIAHVSSIIFVAMLGGALYETIINMVGEKLTGEDDNDDSIWKRTLQEFLGTTGATVLPAFGIGANMGKAISGAKIYRSSLTSLSVIDNVVKTLADAVNEDKDFTDILKQGLTIFVPKSILGK